MNERIQGIIENYTSDVRGVLRETTMLAAARYVRATRDGRPLGGSETILTEDCGVKPPYLAGLSFGDLTYLAAMLQGEVLSIFSVDWLPKVDR